MKKSSMSLNGMMLVHINSNECRGLIAMASIYQGPPDRTRQADPVELVDGAGVAEGTGRHAGLSGTFPSQTLQQSNEC
jgi:hypothetical protein